MSRRPGSKDRRGLDGGSGNVSTTVRDGLLSINGATIVSRTSGVSEWATRGVVVRSSIGVAQALAIEGEDTSEVANTLTSEGNFC